MLLDAFEIIRLVVGIILITIPGFLWSYIFSKQFTFFERIIFGIILSLGFLTSSIYILNINFNIKINSTLTFIIYLVYTIPVVIIYIFSIYKFGFPKIDIKKLNNKKIILFGILIFSFVIGFLPHFLNNHYLPFHVDEWIHWSYTNAVFTSGQTSFVDPYIGKGIISSPEIGFHLLTASIKWISGSSLQTIFLFMPSIIGVLITLTAFNVGERSKRRFGLEAAFLIIFVPTTVRYLGPKFYVPVAVGLFLFIFIIWLTQNEKIHGSILFFPLIFFIFIIHPVTALASILVIFLYSMFLLLEKKVKIAVFNILFSILPILIILILATRWDYFIDRFIETLQGMEFVSKLPHIWITFEHLGILTWALFIFGVYFAFSKGDSIKKTLSTSAILFLIIIGLYSLYSFGFPVVYDRSFLYLFILVTLIAGIGLSEIRKIKIKISDFKILKESQIKKLKLSVLIPIILCILIIGIGLFSQSSIEYYKLINEKEYNDFVWIKDNINNYGDENHTFNRAAIAPSKASAFSAITGLYIISSNVNPLYGYQLSGEMQEFLINKCFDTGFMQKYQISIVYGNCNNSNLTKIYDKVYIYPGLFEK